MVDLVGTLLAHRFGLTQAQIRDKVPGYHVGSDDAVRRTFERDKDELRLLGVPIEVVSASSADTTSYKLGTTAFYLPYLDVVGARGRPKPARVDRYGYHALRECALTDDELRLLADAASHCLSSGDHLLAADARHALAKLSLDLGSATLEPLTNLVVSAPTRRADPATLATLFDAIHRRKQASFTYYGMERDETERRTVQPYLLASTSGHWYLHAMDPARGALRQFRVSRMSDVAINRKMPKAQDFEVPHHFDPKRAAMRLSPWELGEDPVVEVVVEFRATHGAARDAMARGVALSSAMRQVRYTVRRRDPFLRFLLGQAGNAVPVSPPDVVREFQALTERTLAAHLERAS
ncbi:MAG: WYL domain-containing protein [Gemmatimonadales bacterium]